ncbi:MAG: PQQ-dependent sugar dehydrogenase [Longimicrobiales bacterium]|nr:PQQ-dependent sugar dehydrogenase [Longimicrobiales bacterium]
MHRTPLAALAALLLAAPAQAQDIHRTALHDYRVVTVAEGLVNPWSIAFLPGGDILVTERPGRLRIVRDGRLLPDPVAGVPEVFARGQGGLLDVVPHPDFATNHLLYLSYSKAQGENASNTAVVRGRLENDRLTGVEEIWEARSEGRGHYGSRIAFDGRGHVFITAGDRQVPPRGDLPAHPAQDPSNHHGVVVRLNEDGSVPADNPFVGRSDALDDVWSYGHRNPQGLAIHPETGDVWATEHGPQGGDELNLIQPGLNYGWPVVGYGVNYGPGARIHESTTAEGMENPVHFWVPSIATSGLMIYTGDRFPEWRGDFFSGGLAGERIDRLQMDGRTVVLRETILHGLGRVRDVRQGPDGFIYVALDHRGGNPTALVRLEPAR